MGCEYNHAFTGVECGGTAEFTLYRHRIVKHICGPIARHIWSIGRERCYECRRPKWLCWTVERLREEATA